MKISAVLVLLFSMHFPQLGISANDFSKRASDLDYIVYSAFLNEQMEAEQKTSAIRDVTFALDVARFTAENPFADASVKIKRLSKQTYGDFISKAKSSQSFTRGFSLRSNYALLKSQELDAIFSKACPPGDTLRSCNWVEFKTRFPESGGYWSFSAIGYNKAKNQALLEAAWACGSLCGKAWLVLMEAGSDGWKIRSKQLLWIS